MNKKLSKEDIKERIKAGKIKEKTKKGINEFRKEFKKQMNTAIMAAFGFLIALVWKDVITEFVKNLSEKSPFHGALLTAIGVTIVCVLGIMIISRLLKEKVKDEKANEEKNKKEN
jgi:hypothetical protein